MQWTAAIKVVAFCNLQTIFRDINMLLQPIYAKLRVAVIFVSPAITTFVNPSSGYLKMVYLHFGPDLSKEFIYKCQCRYNPIQSHVLSGAK